MKSTMRFLAVLLSLISASLCEDVASTQQSFLREPFDQTAIVGEHVTLPCRVVNMRGVLQWTRDDFGLGNSRELVGFKRYSMTGSDEEGDFTLDINPVSLEDDARFQCQVGAAEGTDPIRSRYATLSVLVPPEAPTIRVEQRQVGPPQNERRHQNPTSKDGEMTVRTVEGAEVGLVCESKGGKPASEITWLDETSGVITDGVSTVRELMSDGKRFITVSTLRFSAARSHHGRSLTCQAQNSADRQPHSTNVRLSVEYPPHVELTSTSDPLLEGETARFKCAADANPGNNLAFQWFLGGEILDGEVTDELVLEGVDRRLNGREVACQVENQVGSIRAVKRLDVSYAPVFLTRPETSSGVSGETVSLKCRVDSNPAAAYVWSHASSPSHAIAHSDELKFVVSPNTVGEYVCRASVPGWDHPEVKASAHVYMRGPPRITNAGKTQTASVNRGESAEVRCEIFSIPSADIVEWSFKGRNINMDDEKYSVKRVESDTGAVSILKIEDVTNEDLGGYLCRTANEFGADSAAIHLRKKIAMPMVVVVTGALGGAILTVAVIMIYILCRRSCCCRCGVSVEKGNNSNDLKSFQHHLNHPNSMLTIQRAKAGSGSSGDSSDEKGSSSTTSDGVSNNSSDLKVDVLRASSALSTETNDNNLWDNNNKRDITDGIMLPRPFEHQTYGNSGFYGQNLSSYEGSSHFHNGGYASSSTTSPPSQHHQHLMPPPLRSHQPVNPYLQQAESLYDGDAKRYSVHVRPPPSPGNVSSPASSGLSSAANNAANSSNNKFGYNASFDYVPASAYCRDSNSPKYGNETALDNYAVYVNNATNSFLTRHEVVVPSVHGKTSSSPPLGSNNSSSLATHV